MEDDAGPGQKGRKVMIWIVLVLIALPILFWLFEYVVPTLLPANF